MNESHGRTNAPGGNEHAAALGEWVRERRLASGVNQRDLAARAGISRSYLCDIERGRGGQPSLACLDRIAGAMGVDRAELLSAAGFLGPSRDAKHEKRVTDLISVYRGLSESGQESLERLARFLLAEEQRWTQPRLVDDAIHAEPHRRQSGPTLFDGLGGQ